MKLQKPLASLSLDLDDKWSYLKTHGDNGWQSFPSYLPVVVPRILDFLREQNLKITFFLVGQDAALVKNHELFRAISDAGHEIGNHSYKHEPWLQFYSETELDREITEAEEKIEYATGQVPIGFRGPGYSLSQLVLQVLTGKGYKYDASTLPTYLNPLARMFYFTTTKFTAEEKSQRKLLYGSFSDGFRPVRPYMWQLDNGAIMEIPVTTMPFFKLPIHFSYLLALSMVSQKLALYYLTAALNLCRLTDAQPSLLLHPTDFLGGDDMQDLSFIPAMGLSSEKKIEFVGEILQLICNRFSIVTLKQHSVVAAQSVDLPIREPDFRKLQINLSERVKCC